MTFTISGTQPEASISGNSLPELVSQAQELLLQIRQHPQFKGLRFDCDVAFGDVKQYFNYLEWAANADSEVSRFEGFTEWQLTLEKI